MKKFAVCLFLALQVTLPAHAANQFVRCVQNQLIALGEDPGPIDGALGRRTRAALSKAIENNPKLSKLPKLSDRFAVTWCRHLAQEGFKTRRHIPYFEGIVVKSDLAEGSQIESNIREQINQLRIWYARQFDVRITSRATIVIAQNGSSAVSLGRKAAKEIGIRDIGETSIRQKCKNPDQGQTAFAGPHILYFCLTNLKDDGSDLTVDTRKFLSLAVPHEYFHSVQYELAADKVPRYYRKGTTPPAAHLRPSWLVEGSADYLMYLYLFPNSSRSSAVRWSFMTAKKYKHKLNTISRNRHLSNGEHYIVSLLAATLLAEKNGANSLLEYWKLIGLGVEHNDAFESTFGISRKALEERFETLRAELDLAVAFTKPKRFKHVEPPISPRTVPFAFPKTP